MVKCSVLIHCKSGGIISNVSFVVQQLRIASSQASQSVLGGLGYIGHEYLETLSGSLICCSTGVEILLPLPLTISDRF